MADLPSAESFLLIDDDPVFLQVLSGALERRGFSVKTALDGETAFAEVNGQTFDYATLDLKLAHESGLGLVEKLLAIQPGLKILMLTGYASIATAVQAVKAGAINYLPKPATVDEILSAFSEGSTEQNEQEEADSKTHLSVGRMEWEHIQKVLAENGGNVSATARALGMHRRTLQRKLSKRPVQN